MAPSSDEVLKQAMSRSHTMNEELSLLFPLRPLSLAEQEKLLRRLKDYELMQQKLERRIRRLEQDNSVIHATYENEVGLRDFQTREKEKQYTYNRLLLEVSPSILIVLNIELRYEVGTSELLAELLCISEPDSLHGQPLEDILKQNLSEESVRQIVDNCRQCLTTRMQIQQNTSLSFQSGRQIHAAVTISTAINKKGEILGLVLLIHDVSELVAMKKAAEAASQAKANFLANMSHELRTPLNAIVGLASLLLSTKLDARQKNYVRNLSKASRILLDIINDTLDFSKIDAQRFEIVCRDYDIADLLASVTSLVCLRAREKGLELLVNAAPSLARRYYGDEQRIHQILLNLLNNAVKYTSAGYIRLDVFPGHEEGEDVLHFRVEDTGIGIKAEDIEHVFTAFTQVDLQKNRHIQGTGLGLAISQGLAHEMGGRVSLESRYGVGSVFMLSIPQKAMTDRVLLSPPADGGTSLVVGDFLSMRVLAEFLEGIPVECRYCRNEDEARLAAAQGFEPRHVFFYTGTSDNECGRIFASLFTGAVLTAVTDSDAIAVDSAFVRHALPKPVLCTDIAAIMEEDSTVSVHLMQDKARPLLVKQVRALLVDDNEINLLVGTKILARYGIDVTTASSGREALELAAGFDFDIIFMDHMMPDLDGTETTKRLRQLGGWCAKVPVVALTAYVVKGMREFFLENGMNDYMGKPIEIALIRTVLERWLPSEKIQSSSTN